MELYTLDPLFRRENVIDQFESLIWTERYAVYGDFQLDIQATVESRSLLQAGTLLAMNKSHRVMTVETIEDSTDSEGRRMLSIKGRSIEAMLLDRVAMSATGSLTIHPNWTLTGTPGAIARKIFHDICVTGLLSPYDPIPFINEGTFTGDDTIDEPADTITAVLQPTTVYDAIAEICKVWDLGFRLIRQYDMSKLWFDVYTGVDRTSSQAVSESVIFTPELDNLHNTKSLVSIDQAKNVAYVYSEAGFQYVYAEGVDQEVDGFERRTLPIVVEGITQATHPNWIDILQQRGREELAKHRTYQAYDGEVSQVSQYVYGRDYNLGDMVEVRGDDGSANAMRVTEQIFVSDREGERSYPTLTLNTYITAGSWLSWTSNTVWQDMGLTEYWDNQP
jgi:hypothetical protein